MDVNFAPITISLGRDSGSNPEPCLSFIFPNLGLHETSLSVRPNGVQGECGINGETTPRSYCVQTPNLSLINGGIPSGIGGCGGGGGGGG